MKDIKKQGDILLLAKPMSNHVLQKIKDFLMLRNTITDQCFRRCVVQLYSHTLSRKEISCVERCTERYAEGNQRVMKHFLDYHTQKQQAEMAAQQKQGNQGQTTLPGQSPTTAPT